MERAAGIIEITKSLPHSRVHGQTVGKTYRVLFHGGRQVDASGTLNAESFVFGNLSRIRPAVLIGLVASIKAGCLTE